MKSPISHALAVAAFALAACRGSTAPADAAPPLDLALGDAATPPDFVTLFDLSPVTGPMLLSQTGLYGDFPSRALAPGVFAFVPRYPLWSDGADKERYLLLPPGTKIDSSDMDGWFFPVGTRAWKQFSVGGTVVETRLLEKVYNDPSGWWEVAYLWKPDGSDAVATPAGQDNALGTAHLVPSQKDCNLCHVGVADVLIGVSALQLSAADGKGPLSRLAALNLLSNPPSAEFQAPGTGVVQDALGYLHGNCGHCHNRFSDVWRDQTRMTLRLSVNDRVPEQTGAYSFIGKKTIHTSPAGSQVAIVPGQPEKSQLYERMGYRDLWAMPPVCTKIVDTAGRKTLHDWILGLPH